MANKKRALILCTGNSARSQMAEGWLRHLAGERFEVASAGTEPARQVNPLAVRAMAEVGIDLSGQYPKRVDRYLGEPWDFVITVCDRAKESCPFFPGLHERIHWSFEDPAAATGSTDERMQVFRRVRDEIAEHLRQLLDGAAS
ncbi:MAG: arsenate reductase ArsC [Chloroflexi bacterium]|nr:arsenate reductase ArsC [Chloroflexota bacterium]